jgi:hypothetical protein
MYKYMEDLAVDGKIEYRAVPRLPAIQKIARQYLTNSVTLFLKWRGCDGLWPGYGLANIHPHPSHSRFQLHPSTITR